MKQLRDIFIKAYDDHSDAIFRHCYFRVFNRDKAKDLVQETFIKTWEYLQKGEGVDNLRAFLYKVATNLIIDDSRKNKPSSLDAMQEEGFDPMGDSGESLPNVIVRGEVRQMLEGINPKYRQAVQLKYIDDLSLKEISKITGESENNISVRIHRGLEELRDLNNE